MGAAPATTWKDSYDDYETNEVAINWNAALAYGLAGSCRSPVCRRPDRGASNIGSESSRQSVIWPGSRRCAALRDRTLIPHKNVLAGSPEAPTLDLGSWPLWRTPPRQCAPRSLRFHRRDLLRQDAGHRAELYRASCERAASTTACIFHRVIDGFMIQFGCPHKAATRTARPRAGTGKLSRRYRFRTSTRRTRSSRTSRARSDGQHGPPGTVELSVSSSTPCTTPTWTGSP